jgi:hypothetical protein
MLTPLGGCMNMPTPTSQITGAYVSGLKYENYDCSRLSAELGSLSRRENQLVIAQQQRIRTSEMQAFWYGYGQGDGIEASELANVRGEREAIRTAMDVKTCRTRAWPAEQAQLDTASPLSNSWHQQAPERRPTAEPKNTGWP